MLRITLSEAEDILELCNDCHRSMQAGFQVTTFVRLNRIADAIRRANLELNDELKLKLAQTKELSDALRTDAGGSVDSTLPGTSALS